MNDMNDRVITRLELRKQLGVRNETVRAWIKAKKLPPLDVNITRRIQGWRLSTLREHGVNIVG